MANLPWVGFVGWCVAFGVPMTPLAGSAFGYGLLGIAALTALYQAWVWMNSLQYASSPIVTRFVVWLPTILLILMATVWSYFGGLPAIITVSPKLGLYFNGQPIEGQRIPIKMERSGASNSVEYHISLWNIEIREEGRKVGAQISTPRWHLSEKDIRCLGDCADGDSEPSDAAQYPTVFRGRPFQVDAGGKSFIRQMTFLKRGHPAPEIRVDLELFYGNSDPLHAKFTMLPYE